MPTTAAMRPTSRGRISRRADVFSAMTPFTPCHVASWSYRFDSGLGHHAFRPEVYEHRTRNPLVVRAG
ncbi:protein of unknown function [Pararobbsia alpina]